MKKENYTNPNDSRLLAQIDEILTHQGEIPGEEGSLQHLCVQLANSVPRADPAFQYRLKERLLAQWQEKNRTLVIAKSPNGNKGTRFRLWFQKFIPGFSGDRRNFRLPGEPAMKKSVVLFTFIAIAITLITLAFVPPVRAALYDALKQIDLGPYTSIIQVDSIPGEKPMYTQGDLWIIRTEIGNYSGNAPPGVEPVVKSVGGIEEAQALTDLHIKIPAYLPSGYTLDEIKLAPIGATNWAISIYRGPGHDIVIAQLPGGPQPSQDPNAVSSVKTGILTDGTIDNVDFDGRPAAWIEGHTLLWEVDGVSYEVGGLDLDLEEAMRIGRSLH